MPFVTAGDPDLAFTADVLAELAGRGAHLCEVGIPYSDPIADGPVIQASYTRALARHVKLAQILEMLSGVTQKVTAPLVTMVSYAIIHRHGPARYVEDAQRAGLAGAIVPDLLIEESADLAEICRASDFSLVQLVTPTTPRERALRIADSSTGFLYYVSVTGITGERNVLPQQLLDNVAWLREQTDTPICIGFGISQPEHVRLLAPVADGLIVGSAIVRRIAAAETRPRAEVLRDVGEYVGSLLKSLCG
jgi:tryptophan synthase alpha chain